LRLFDARCDMGEMECPYCGEITTKRKTCIYCGEILPTKKENHVNINREGSQKTGRDPDKYQEFYYEVTKCQSPVKRQDLP